MFRDTEQELKRLEEELLEQEEQREPCSDEEFPEIDEELELEEILREFSDPDRTQVFQGDEAEFREKLRKNQERRVYNGDCAGEVPDVLDEEAASGSDAPMGLVGLSVLVTLGMAISLIWILVLCWR